MLLNLIFGKNSNLSNALSMRIDGNNFMQKLRGPMKHMVFLRN